MNQEYYNTEKTKGKRLCAWERKEIEKGLKQGASMGKIAKGLGRNKSTICREIRRGSVTVRKRKYYEPIKKEHKAVWSEYSERREYFADRGQAIAREHLKNRGGKYKLFEDPELVRYIEEKILKDKWSPAATIGELRTREHKFKTTVCFKTVYNYIDRGLLKVKNIDLLMKTRLKQKKKRVRTRKRELGRSIELRAKEVETREEFGHWECDTVVGKNGKSAIMTLVERKTNKGILLSLKDKSADAVMSAFKGLKGFESIFKSITFDNGSEFAKCHNLERDGIQIYFAHPYSAWERGINENYNRMIRRFIPKGKDFNAFDQAALNRINNWIDSLPRKRHGYKSAEAIFNLELACFTAYPMG
jgi:IS30 family transposase